MNLFDISVFGVRITDLRERHLPRPAALADDGAGPVVARDRAVLVVPHLVARGNVEAFLGRELVEAPRADRRRAALPSCAGPAPRLRPPRSGPQRRRGARGSGTSRRPRGRSGDRRGRGPRRAAGCRTSSASSGRGCSRSRRRPRRPPRRTAAGGLPDSTVVSDWPDRSSSAASTSSGRKARSQTTSGHRVQHLVDAVEAEVGHPDDVQVRVAERDAERPRPRDGRQRDLGVEVVAGVVLAVGVSCQVIRRARVDHYSAEKPGKRRTRARAGARMVGMRFDRRETDRAGAERREMLRLEPASQAQRVWSSPPTACSSWPASTRSATARDFLLPLVIGVMLYFLLVPAGARG